MMRRLDWTNFRSAEFDHCDPHKTIAILPTAAVEQHGPHLPVGTDTYIAEGMLDSVRGLVPDDLDVRILPVQAVGKSNEHLYAKGTLTLTATTALAVWTEIGLSVARAGIRKIVIVNSHGGNADINSILARELRVQANMMAVKCSWGSFGLPEGLVGAQEWDMGLHGGDVETSLMLAIAPNTVNMAHAPNALPSDWGTPVPPVGTVSYGWIASDLHDAGVVGDATQATADKGRAIIAHQARGFIDMLRKVQEMAVPSGS